MNIFLLVLIITFVSIGVFFVCLSLTLLFFNLSLIFGAPFVPTPVKVVERMLKLVGLKPGEVLYDLGSGDGRILIWAAQNYDIKAVGYEINPFLVYLSRQKTRKLGLHEKIKIRWGNFFRKNLSDADVILIYLFQVTNNFLEKKFLSELKPGTQIVSLSFTFNKIPFIKSDSVYPHIRLYQIPK